MTINDKHHYQVCEELLAEFKYDVSLLKKQGAVATDVEVERNLKEQIKILESQIEELEERMSNFRITH